MADAPPSGGGQSFGARMSRKVGPLPVWAWAVIVLVVGYFLYKRFGTGSSTATGTSPASASVTTDTTPIPAGDQSGGGAGSASGSTGTQTPTGGSFFVKESPGGSFPARTESTPGSNTSSGFHEQIGGFSSGSGQRAASGGFRAV